MRVKRREYNYVSRFSSIKLTTMESSSCLIESNGSDNSKRQVSPEWKARQWPKPKQAWKHLLSLSVKILVSSSIIVLWLLTFRWLLKLKHNQGKALFRNLLYSASFSFQHACIINIWVLFDWPGITWFAFYCWFPTTRIVGLCATLGTFVWIGN